MQQWVGSRSRRAVLPVTAMLCVLNVLAAGFEAKAEVSRTPATEEGRDEKHPVHEDDYELRFSLPTQQDHDAWRSPGFRMQLGYAHARFWGQGRAPNFAAHQVLARPQVRIDDWWSIAATVGYAVAGSGVRGVHWRATIEPMLHLAGGLAVSVGLGYAGIMGSSTTPRRDAASAVGYDTRLDWQQHECDDGGWVAVGRVEYLLVVGSVFATGPFASAGAHWVACTELVGLRDSSTGQSLGTPAWWQHQNLNLGWWATWR